MWIVDIGYPYREELQFLDQELEDLDTRVTWDSSGMMLTEGGLRDIQFGAPSEAIAVEFSKEVTDLFTRRSILEECTVSFYEEVDDAD